MRIPPPLGYDASDYDVRAIGDAGKPNIPRAAGGRSGAQPNAHPGSAASK
jgi:hypothetical protein